MTKENGKYRVFTWHVHGNYLYYLSQISDYEFILPVAGWKKNGYGGRAKGLPWPDNVREVPADRVREVEFDIILFQDREHYLDDSKRLFSPAQLELPKIYLEHDPPRESPTDTRHVVREPDILVVHVTHYNRLMWDNGNSPTAVIEHGVRLLEPANYTGEWAKGVVVVNDLDRRGRRLGLDVFEKVRDLVPLDLIGMGSERLGGLGEVPHHELSRTLSRYRFLFYPIRHTSLGLTLIEAMMTGLPVVGLATTELPTVIENGVSGYIHTDVDYLVEKMRDLLQNREKAYELGVFARLTANSFFGIERFTRRWKEVMTRAINSGKSYETENSLYF